MIQIRYELWNDSLVYPTEWNGRGQPTEWKKTKPTKWYIAWHIPDVRECACVHEFLTISCRKAHIELILEEAK